MTIKDLININSAYGSIACIRGEESVISIRGYLAYNFDFIKQFESIILAINWMEDVSDETVDRYVNQWRMAFPNSNVYTVRACENMGHTLGTMDLDNILFDVCKDYNIQWLFKSTEDIIIDNKFSDKKIPTGADFYYFNGIEKGGMVKYNFNFERIIKKDFYPNTNFYIINTESLNYLYNKQGIDEAYELVSNIPNYSGRIWDHIPGFSSEAKLAEIAQQQGLTVYHLIPTDKYLTLLQTIDRNDTHDNSHKNICIEGVCHFHFPDQPVIIIE